MFRMMLPSYADTLIYAATTAHTPGLPDACYIIIVAFYGDARAYYAR